MPSAGGSAKFHDTDFFDPQRKWSVLLNAQHGLNITTEPGLVAKLMDRFFVRYKTEPPRIARLGARGPIVLFWHFTEREAGLLIEYLKGLNTGAVTVRRFYNACMREFYGRRDDEGAAARSKRKPRGRNLHGLGCPACLLFL
jgi:hypothetical protein